LKLTTVILFLFLGVCGTNAQRFDILNGDTVNFVDTQNNKQGYWLTVNPESLQKIQEGNYFKGKKEGIWKTYYVNGNLKSEISYKDGEKYGFAKIYYENGKLAEEGMWLKDKWVGKYKSYYSNGKLSYLWNYNDYGKRSGYQLYFYENGNIKIDGEWFDGKENGQINEYYQSGVLKYQKVFLNGKCECQSVKIYREEENIKKENPIKIDSVINSQTDIKFVTEVDTIKVFNGTGSYILYRKDKKPEREGEFIDGILMNGKEYIYNAIGELIKIQEYKDGRPKKTIE